MLVVFEDGDESSSDGESGSVEGVNELRFCFGLGAVADVGAAGLEVGEVGAG